MASIRINSLNSRKNSSRIYIIIIILLLMLPAFFINLGTSRLIDDESIRVIVALEMKISGDYLTPTIGGDHYYKKPPVFNWLISLAHSISGNYSEIPSRTVNIVFLFIYGLTIYLVIRKKYGNRIAYLSAFLFMVCGRIIIYESLYGLIDITYSWLIFLNFILIWRYLKSEKYLTMFLISYLITAITFLLKGIPPLAFQAITLLVATIPEKKWRLLYSWKHILGILLFVCVAGSYYLAYALRNPEQISDLLSTLYHESADKSAVSYGFKDILLNIITYSFQIFYSYVPGTLLVFFFIRRQPLKYIKEDPFLLYLSRVFVFNIIIYLISPLTFLRYVLMLMPIITLFFVIYFLKSIEKATIHRKIFQISFIIIAMFLFLITPAYAFNEATNFVKTVWLKIGCIMAASGLVIWLMIRYPKLRIELLVISFLLARIGFNWFIIPSRVNNHWETRAKNDAIRIGQITKEFPLYELTEQSKLTRPTHIVPLCYLTAERQQIIYTKKNMDSPGYYLVYDPEKKFSHLQVDSLAVRPGFSISLIKTNKFAE